MYHTIFLANVRRQLAQRHMTKRELSVRSGGSISFLSDLTSGKANPSLKVMEGIARAFDMPLPLLLESSDEDTACKVDARADAAPARTLPAGFERVAVVLPAHQALVVRKWGDAARKKLRGD